jgi:microcystin-dependent protein
MPQAYATTIFTFGSQLAPGTINSGATAYLAGFDGASAATDVYKIAIPHAGVLRNLYWRASASTLSGIGHAIKVLKNGILNPPVGTPELKATWNSNATSGSGVNPVPDMQVVAGDVISVVIQLKVGGGRITGPTVSFELLEAPPIGSQWIGAGSDIYFTGGKVGIGTMAPQTDLDVVGAIKTDGLQLPTGAANGYILTSDVNGNGTWKLPAPGGGIGGGGITDRVAKFTDTTTIGDSAIYEFGGNVGIGTTNPIDPLSVNGVISTSQGVRFPDGNVQVKAAGSGIVNSLQGADGSPDAVFVDYSRNVGIGTINPGQKLTLSQDSVSATDMATPTIDTIATHAQSGQLQLVPYYFRVVAEDGAGGRTAGSLPEYSITPPNANNRGVHLEWTSVPGAKQYRIYITKTTGGPYQYLISPTNSFDYNIEDPNAIPDTVPEITTAYVNQLAASGASWLLGGNVGIGTTSPQAKLDVEGDIRLQAGSVINEFSIDQTLSGNSDLAVPTERAVQEYIDNLFVGSVAAFAMELPPDGWLECDGQALSRVGYARLFNRIGTTFGMGDGLTTFNMPDLRGRFIRGWAHGSPSDPDRAQRTPSGSGGASDDKVGSHQDTALQSHIHDFTGTAAGTASTDTYFGGDFAKVVPGGTHVAAVAWPGLDHVPASINHAHSFTPSGKITSPTSGKISTETRPINIYLMYCIKY